MKTLRMIFAALLVLAAVSCSRQEVIDSPAEEGEQEVVSPEVVLVPMRFSAGKEEIAIPAPDAAAPAVRSYIDSGSILWESSDAVAVYDDVDSSVKHVFEVTPGDPATGATLEGEVAEGSASFFAVYPAAAASGVDGSSVTVTVPAAQVIPAGKNIDPSALVSVAYADRGDALAFKNVCGFLQLTISYANIKSVTISGAKIAGEATVAGSTGVISSNASATDSITLTYEGDAVFPTGTYYIALLPGTTAAGNFTVSMTQDVAGFTATRTAGGAVEIVRKGGFTFGTLDTALSWEYRIGSAADLMAWHGRYSEWRATDVVRLTADIDMDGVSWTPVQQFAGTFDGLDPGDGTTIHKIYNLVISRDAGNVCLINHMTGTFRNVIFGSSDGTSWDGTSTFTLTGADDGSWHYTGIIGRMRASMSYVTSFVKVVVAAGCEKKVRVGGLVGITPDDPAEDGIKIDHCYFRGAISILTSASNKTGTQAIHIGGVVGCSDAKKTIPSVTNCVNYGSISTTDEYTTYVGGIIGFVGSGCFFNIENSDNEGTLSYVTTLTNATSYVGGIAGYMNGNNEAGCTIKNCKNKSNLEVRARGVQGIGGIIGYAGSVAISNKCANQGNLSMTRDWKGNQMYMGGIAGYLAGTGSVDDCSNSGNLESCKNKVNIVGGICGVVRNGQTDPVVTPITVTNCTNSGKCTVYRAATNPDWQACGGIVGQQESSSATISGNTNTGEVKIQMPNTTGHVGGMSAGGILGLGFTATEGTTCALSGNTNTGNVSLTNSGASAMDQSVGGIIGRTRNSQITSTGDTSNCAVSRSVGATATGGIGAAVGLNSGGVITNPVLGGSVNGVTLTAGNVAEKAIGSGTAATGVTLVP